jgi:hypothetical protein
MASAVEPVGSLTELLDCRVCGAPNAAHREGCFNCGSLLQLSGEVPVPEIERLTHGDADRPGRVVYVGR